MNEIIKDRWDKQYVRNKLSDRTDTYRERGLYKLSTKREINNPNPQSATETALLLTKGKQARAFQWHIWVSVEEEHDQQGEGVAVRVTRWDRTFNTKTLFPDSSIHGKDEESKPTKREPERVRRSQWKDVSPRSPRSNSNSSSRFTKSKWRWKSEGLGQHSTTWLWRPFAFLFFFLSRLVEDVHLWMMWMCMVSVNPYEPVQTRMNRFEPGWTNTALHDSHTGTVIRDGDGLCPLPILISL